MKRYLSIFLVMLTLILLFVNWVDSSNTNTQNMEYFGVELDEIDVLHLKYYGIPDSIIELCGEMLSNMAISPFGFVLCGVITELTNNYVNVWLIITVSLYFVLLLLFLLKLIIQHIFGRRPRGYGTFLLVILLFVLFCSMRADSGGELTPAGFVAVAAMLASCILWGQHIKAVGVIKGRYTLKEKMKCPKCGAESTDASNMFCEKCNALIDSN